jgi:hypothetical protein
MEAADHLMLDYVYRLRRILQDLVAVTKKPAAIWASFSSKVN